MSVPHEIILNLTSPPLAIPVSWSTGYGSTTRFVRHSVCLSYASTVDELRGARVSPSSVSSVLCPLCGVTTPVIVRQ
jgi:hypothetical protein